MIAEMGVRTGGERREERDERLGEMGGVFLRKWREERWVLK